MFENFRCSPALDMISFSILDLQYVYHSISLLIYISLISIDVEYLFMGLPFSYIFSGLVCVQIFYTVLFWYFVLFVYNFMEWCFCFYKLILESKIYGSNDIEKKYIFNFSSYVRVWGVCFKNNNPHIDSWKEYPLLFF